ncbi:trypsin-like peptidase domain-containing protein [Candidatus Falkowbacteria bacterium]|nr:trypsin-like peptidase domain-containing protein [Candidatus Falkowbacteria bacterium]
MFQDKALQKIVIVAALTSLIFGGAAGVLGGLYGKSYVIPWFQKNFLGENVVVGENVEEQAITQAVIEESATVGAVKKVAPAVVSIIISKDISKINNFNNFPYDLFGFNFPFGSGQPSAGDTSGGTGKTEIGGGTGFIISSDGLILTNKHVASDAEAEYTVITNDDQKYDAKILATDPILDIAVLKIDAKDLPTVELGDSDKIDLGQTVIAIGNSLGEYKNTVTKGVISGIDRRIVAGDNQGGSEVIEEAIQTDAAINPGNSGGPLINLAGQVIAINTAMNQEGQLIGFAIPINAAKQDIDSVKTSGKIVRPWLGVRYVLINEEIAKENQLEKNYGALVIRGQKQTDLAIVPGSPADKAGLVENDIILEMNGQKIDEEHPLAREIAKFKPGDEITLKVLHKGEEKDVKVALGEYKD